MTTQIVGGSRLHQPLINDGVTSFYVGLIGYDFFTDKKGRRELCFRALLSEDKMRHEASYQPKFKFPGGDAKREELPSDTARREYKEEVLLLNSQVDLNLEDLALEAALVHQVDKPDQTGRKTKEGRPGKHRKMFYLFDEHKLAGYTNGKHFRMEPRKEEDEEGQPGGLIYAPTLIRVPTLCQLFYSTCARYHWEAVIKAADFLLRTNPGIAETLPHDFMREIPYLMGQLRFQWNR